MAAADGIEAVPSQLVNLTDFRLCNLTTRVCISAIVKQCIYFTRECPTLLRAALCIPAFQQRES